MEFINHILQTDINELVSEQMALINRYVDEKNIDALTALFQTNQNRLIDLQAALKKTRESISNLNKVLNYVSCE